MRLISPKIKKTATGAILFDGNLFDDISDEVFDAGHWQASSPVAGGPGSSGRGNTMIVRNAQGEFVLRHFMRGGLVGRFVSESYIWLGEEATRAFGEWRLLAKLVAMDLPVPKPAAARYTRKCLRYQADMLTVLIPDVMPLSDRIAERPGEGDFWERLGSSIAAFHEAGVYHADLNAYNIQIDKDDKPWLIDFDRGRLRQPGSWQRKNLSRLHRSLQKIKRLHPDSRFSEDSWIDLLEGYFNASRFE
jgi:3-deoxy-D-manno-octulosonic acid kinase